MIDINIEFYKWVKGTEKYYANRGVGLDYLKVNNVDIEITDNPATRADYLTEKYMGSVIVWKSGFMDIQIMDIETEKMVLYEHFDCISVNEFEECLKVFFEILFM